MNIIGADVLVEDIKGGHHEHVGAEVIDKVAGTDRPKRVRLATGEHAGEVRQPGQYKLEAIFA